MILAALSLLLTAQTVPEETVGDEIVVEAKAGLVTLVFDRRAGGGLANCRVLKGSGVKRIDATACADFLDCVSDDAKSACGNAAPEQLAAIRREMPDSSDGKPRFTIPKLVQPEKPKIPAVGPVGGGDDDTASDQIVKLPPKPEDKTFSPAITISGSSPPCRNQELPC
ncbi:hypothetical protein [Stakelama pacifica]|uniref:Uncharacterized protein n=1 Tax=Stakelama pacifica TaxID=517720 RepID=A0A4R6FQ15_9SPHN|nr:hypothetical protein [Stakelama pacifica]TDN83662.1 hypothetical protein EV664_104146 [Stakelama pacifica]GGO94460.1 hypothetical protein GCM10011329_16360 [Stakelama pacifica]